MVLSVLLAGVVIGTASGPATPLPVPLGPVPKTIVTVHSSRFCAALRESVAPALAGIIRNDQVIMLGRAASLAMNNEMTFGGILQSSFNQQGAAQVGPPAGSVTSFVQRERQIASSLEHNVETVETILADSHRFTEHPANDEQSTLSSIKAQLMVTVNQQRALVNLLSGEAETTALTQLFDAYPSGGNAAAGSLSPLQAQEAKYDPALRLQALTYSGYTSFGDSAYAKIAQVIEIGQKAIAASESKASKAIIDSVPGCVSGR